MVEKIGLMKEFYSKLLLFGEYTVIKGSAALAIPYQRYSGQWRFAKEKTKSNKILGEWLVYLQQQTLDFDFQFDRFAADLANGLTFDSDIPQGYGVGSSGALCAALLHEYVTVFYSKKKDIFYLKKCFIQLEDFFHGKGSGIDPLICYFNRPMTFQTTGITLQNNWITTENTPTNQVCFLINTHIERQTEPLVTAFLEQCEKDNYSEKLTKELVQYNNNAIEAILKKDYNTLFNTLPQIAQFQFEAFQKMIPPSFNELWRRSLDEEAYDLKLCGAGGGGFILGFAKDWTATQAILNEYDLELVFYLND